MKKSIKIIFLFMLFHGIQINKAEAQWYIAQDGDITTDSAYKIFYATISQSVAGTLNLYFRPHAYIACPGVGQIDSMYFNGTQVRMYQNCDSFGTYWYPLTSEGTKFLIGLFSTSGSVTMVYANGLKDTFYTYNFANTLNQFLSRKGGL